jgi:hypothetical protein
MPREKRTKMRVPGDIPHKIISEWKMRCANTMMCLFKCCHADNG